MAEREDYLYDEGIYIDRIPENFSCPICLCPVQRAAHLTVCCGKHFCFDCISKVISRRDLCPMCKGNNLRVFPNKERQREVNQLRVRCPVPHCDPAWEGVLGQLERHVRQCHNEPEDAYLFKSGTYVVPPPQKFTCPVCRCLVQRAAQLSLCCGVHVCLQCAGGGINRPCPACEAGELKVVPNKERQREINQLMVRCPFVGQCPLSWEGELCKLQQHIRDMHEAPGQGAAAITDGVSALHLEPTKTEHAVGGATVNSPGSGTARSATQNGTSAVTSMTETAVSSPQNGNGTTVSGLQNGNFPGNVAATVAVDTGIMPIPRSSNAPVAISEGESWNATGTTPPYLEWGHYDRPHHGKHWGGQNGHHRRGGHHGHHGLHGHHGHHVHHGRHPGFGMPPPPPPHPDFPPPPPHPDFPPPPPHPNFPPPPPHPDFPPPPRHSPFNDPPSPHHPHHGHHGGRHRGRRHHSPPHC
eukprot:Em0003g1472a